MFKTFFSLFTKGRVLAIAGQAIPAIVDLYNPPLGALLQNIFVGILHSEALNTDKGQGNARKDIATSMLQVAMPEISALFDRATKPIKNPELFAEGSGEIMSGLVKVMNATGENAKTAT